MFGARDPLAAARFYLIPIDTRRLNAGPGPLTRDTVRKSYEFALNHVGQDKDSGEIWSDFIQFLKSADVCYPFLFYAVIY
jgi:cleavage stimulation factor subunit 3